jgi:hypothetical protein
MQVEEASTSRSGFTQLSNILIDTVLLNRVEKLILWALISFSWDNPGCFPGRDRLAVMTGYSERVLVDGLASLRKKKMVEYKRRGYGRTNYYKFLDPTIQDAINRLIAERAEQEQEPEPQPDSSPSATEPIIEPTIAQTTTTEPIAEPATKSAPIEPEPEFQPLAAEPVTPIEPIKKEAAPAPAEQTKVKLHIVKPSQPAPTTDKEKDIQKEKETSKRTNAQTAKSQFALSVCISFALSLRVAGINNPYGYGRAIWQDGSEDERICEFVEAQRKQRSSISTEQQAQELFQLQQLLMQRDEAFNGLDVDAREGLILEKLAEFEASPKWAVYARLPKNQLIDQAIWEIKKELVPGFDQS